MPDGGRAKGLIVVADDDEDVRELVVFRLARAGYEVLAAGDGEHALGLIMERRPDMALLDVMMPGLDGYEVTRRLRATDGAATPVILLTASVHEEAVEKGFDAGADDYIRKPFSPQELLSRVAAVLDPA